MKLLLRLTVLVCFFSFAHAQDLRFGVRLGADVTSPVALHLRADLPGGFGVRVIAGSWVILSGLETMAYYRFSSGSPAFDVYVGAGGGLLAAFPIGFVGGGPLGIAFAPYVAGLLGLEYNLSDRISLFLEARPSFLFNSNPTPAFIPLLGVGLNFYL